MVHTLANKDFGNFMSAVISKSSFDKIDGYLQRVKNGDIKGTSVLVGGGTSDKTGYFIEPTVLVTTDPQSKTMTDELFGPVVTCYVYPVDKFEETVYNVINIVTPSRAHNRIRTNGINVHIFTNKVSRKIAMR